MSAAARINAAPLVRLQFSLPTIHCPACLNKIENRLSEMPGLHRARVNLSLKRLTVEGAVAADEVLGAVSDLGFEAYPLDPAALENSTDRTGRDLLLCLAVAGFAMMNVMLLSVAVWSGADGATRDLFHLISAAIAIPVVIYSGQPFFRNAWRALSVWRLNMDVPISLAIILATGMSLWESLQSGPHAYFDAALSLTFFLLIGRYLDHRTRSSARSAAQELAALEEHSCTRVKGQEMQTVAIGEIAVGDRILVACGMRVPVDGELISDLAVLDRSLLTGESEPCTISKGADVQAGVENLSSPFQLRATAIGEETFLRRVAALVATAENNRNSYTALADRAAKIYAPAVHMLALLALLGWWFATSDFRLALNIAIAVLIITCPCALGLAVPSVNIAAVGRLFRSGFLVKHATALERLAEADYAVFDKTGTLSAPDVSLSKDVPADAQRVCLALAQHSKHPLSRSLAKNLSHIEPAELEQVAETAGEGMTAQWRGMPVALGRQGRFSALGLQIGQDSYPVQLREKPLPGARQALAELDMPAEVISGDMHKPTEEFGRKMGLAVRARIGPEAKVERLEELKDQGHRVLMLGDGLNDTAALAAAHVAVAPASALDASRSAADVILLKENLSQIPFMIRVARAAGQLSKQNFAIAAGYNFIAIPIALAGFATPLMAAIAMSVSSLTVLLNSQRIRRLK